VLLWFAALHGLLFLHERSKRSDMTYLFYVTTKNICFNRAVDFLFPILYSF